MKAEKTAAIILAAGASARFGGGDKLLAPFRGKPLGAHAADAALGAPFAQRLAVVPPDAPARRAMFSARGLDTVENPTPSAGQGASLAAGVQALGDGADLDGALVLLADMPFITSAHLQGLLAAIGAAPAAASRVGDRIGPPALFAARLFPDLRRLTGDVGAKGLLAGLPGLVTAPLPSEDAVDFDVPMDFDEN